MLIGIRILVNLFNTLNYDIKRYIYLLSNNTLCQISNLQTNAIIINKSKPPMKKLSQNTKPFVYSIQFTIILSKCKLFMYLKVNVWFKPLH